uniref:Uncharacterized protein n=1 Tax=Anguilla anguilla TaxID=7936 RepID=A0A0E9Q2N6_ANGAN
MRLPHGATMGHVMVASATSLNLFAEGNR